MDDIDLLESTFNDIGRKHGLDSQLLAKIFDYMIKNQYLRAGKREAIRGQLEQIIRKHMKG